MSRVRAQRGILSRVRLASVSRVSRQRANVEEMLRCVQSRVYGAHRFHRKCSKIQISLKFAQSPNVHDLEKFWISRFFWYFLPHSSRPKCTERTVFTENAAKSRFRDFFGIFFHIRPPLGIRSAPFSPKMHLLCAGRSSRRFCFCTSICNRSAYSD